MAPRFDLINIVVADMARSLAFYRLVGFEFPDDADSQPHVEVTLDGGIRIAWDTETTITSFEPSWTRPVGGHALSMAFDCGTATAVDATFAELTAAGHGAHLEPWDAFWGQRYATVLDPDGNSVDLFAELG